MQASKWLNVCSYSKNAQGMPCDIYSNATCSWTSFNIHVKSWSRVKTNITLNLQCQYFSMWCFSIWAIAQSNDTPTTPPLIWLPLRDFHCAQCCATVMRWRCPRCCAHKWYFTLGWPLLPICHTFWFHRPLYLFSKPKPYQTWNLFTLFF